MYSCSTIKQLIYIFTSIIQWQFYQFYQIEYVPHTKVPIVLHESPNNTFSWFYYTTTSQFEQMSRDLYSITACGVLTGTISELYGECSSVSDSKKNSIVFHILVELLLPRTSCHYDVIHKCEIPSSTSLRCEVFIPRAGILYQLWSISGWTGLITTAYRLVVIFFDKLAKYQYRDNHKHRG